MKKYRYSFYILLAIACFVLGFTLTGCSHNDERIQQAIQQNVYGNRFTYEGHTYIKFRWVATNAPHVGVVHDPDCQCHKN